jgi:hypothetical protein
VVATAGCNAASLATDATDAGALFDRAVENFLKYHADVMSLVGRRMQADPQFALGHCRKG